MLASFPIAAVVGLILGFLSGMGVGGGSLLILWLTTALSMEQRMAQGINLLFFLPAAICACLFHIKNKRLPWKTVLFAALSGSVTAALCAYLAGHIETSLLRKLFGVLLLFTGLSELFRKPKKSDHS